MTFRVNTFLGLTISPVSVGSRRGIFQLKIFRIPLFPRGEYSHSMIIFRRIFLISIQLFQKTCQKKSKYPISQAPQGSMGSFKSVFIAAVKRELKKPRRRRRGQRLKYELMFCVRISRYPKVIYYVYLCPSYHETTSTTHR